MKRFIVFLASSLVFTGLVSAQTPQGTVTAGGNPVPGIVLNLSTPDGVTCVTTTDMSGVYTFDTCLTIGGDEACGPDCFYTLSVDERSVAATLIYQLPFGPQGGASRQVACDEMVDFDLMPIPKCESPNLITPCFLFEGESSDFPNDGSMVSFPTSAAWPAGPGNVNNTYLANFAETGAMGGVAYDPCRNTVYGATIAMRHTDTGPGADGILRTADDYGAIYVMPAGGGGVTSVITIPNANYNSAFNLTVPPNDANFPAGAPTLPRMVDTVAQGRTAAGGWAYDSYVFDTPGKVGLGDIQMSEDCTKLFVVNLADRNLYYVDLTTPANTVVNVGPIQGPGCPSGEWRPWALEWHGGDLYVGGVCSAEGVAPGPRPETPTPELSAHVYRFCDPCNSTAADLVYEQTLDYGKDQKVNGMPATGVPDFWGPWIGQHTTDVEQVQASTDRMFIEYIAPMLTDIEFQVDGSMALGFRDRGSDQYKGGNGVLGAFVPNGPVTAPRTINTRIREHYSSGDVRKACWVDSAAAPAGEILTTQNCVPAGVPVTSPMGYWEEEGGPNCPSNMGRTEQEFYNEDGFDGGGKGNHSETAQGHLALLAGCAELVTTTMDPYIGFANVRSGGASFYNDFTGGRNSAYSVFVTDQANTPGKGNGLGDIEFTCGNEPVQVGGTAWCDCDMDGIHDPFEAPQVGIPVDLYSNGVLIASTTTDADGHWFFTGVAANLDHYVEFTVTDPLTIADANNNMSDTQDSDAYVSGAGARIDFKTVEGRNKHDLGLGLICGPYALIDDTATSERDLGCVYSASQAELYFPDAPFEIINASGDCNGMTIDDVLVVTTNITVDGCQTCWERVSAIMATECCTFEPCPVTQRVCWVTDLEPPKVICPPGRSLGCIPPGVDPVDYVALAAPFAMDATNVVVVENCTNCTPEICLWCDTYTTNGCVVTLDRKIRATDCCGNVGMCTIIYTMNDILPAITNLPTGGDMGCQDCAWRPPTNQFGFTCPYDPAVTNISAADLCIGPLSWTQAGGVDPGAGGLFVNDFSSATPAGTVLSFGSVDCSGVVADYEVVFNYLNGQRNAGNPPNNSFVIRPNGFADWFTSTDIGLDPNAGASITFNFFAPGTYNPVTGTGTVIDFGMSLVALNDQPPNGGATIGRLNTIEELYIDAVPGLCGVTTPGQVSFSDPFTQLVYTAAVPPGFDYTLKWEAPGFGNNLNGNGALEVNEAQFSMNLPPAGSFTLVRGNDAGQRSGVGFNGAVGPPTASEAFVIPECGTNVTESVTTNGCEVTITRTYSVTGCCDQVVSEDVVWTFTKIPDLSTGPLAKLDLGCIATTNQIPPVDLTMFAASSTCEIVSIAKLGQSAPVLAANGCTWSNERVFVVETLCSVTQMVTQSVCWVINNSRPEILATAKDGVHFGCATNVPRTLAESLAALEIVNATQTTLVSEVFMDLGCDVMVVRTWRVEDCCGNFDRREESFMYTPASELLADATINPTVDVGCVSSVDLIPETPMLTMQSTGNIFCYSVTNRFFDERLLTRSDPRGLPTTFPVVSPDGSFVITGSHVNDDNGFLLVPGEVVTAQFSSPATFCVTTDNLNNDGYCMSPAPSAATFHPLHMVTTNAAGICLLGDLTATTADASTLIFSNVSSISIAGIDGTSDFRIKAEFVFTEELTEFVDGDGNTIYVDGNGNQVPLPANATLCRQGCDIDVSFVGTQASTVVTEPCQSAFERVYQIAANCSTSTVTQTVLYALDTSVPRIASVSNYVDYGCVTNEPRSLVDSLAAIVAVDAISTQFVMETRASDGGCHWTVTRTWRVEDCCGNFDLKQEVYGYTLPQGQSLLALNGYTEFGDATPITGGSQLTSANPAQSGASWAPGTLDLTQPFTACYDIFLGANDGGADGIAFMLTPGGPVPPVGSGGSLGAVLPGLGVAVDTWPTSIDTSYIFANNPASTVTGPVNVGQLEDGALHGFKAIWDPATMNYRVFIDGVLVHDITRDIVALDMGGSTTATYGWTGATGGAVNNQAFIPAGVLVGAASEFAFANCPGDTVIGCITSSNQIPVAVLSATGACDIAVSHADGPHTPVAATCGDWTFERVFTATDGCGASILCTQAIVYTLDIPPVAPTPEAAFTATCVAPNTLPAGLPAALAGVNVSTTVTTNGCDVALTRAYTTNNCCGASAQASVTHTWTELPPPPVLFAVPTRFLGCILSTNAIPDASAANIDVTAPCGYTMDPVVSTAPVLGADGCTYTLTNTYSVTDPCGQTTPLEQVVSYVLDLVPEILAVEKGTNVGCVASDFVLPFNAGAVQLNLPVLPGSTNYFALPLSHDPATGVIRGNPFNFGGDPANVINDPFAWDPNAAPNAVSPDQVFTSDRPFSFGTGGGEVSYTFPSNCVSFIDIWARFDGCCPDRDDNIDINFYAGGVLVYQALGQMVPDSNQFLRVTLPSCIPADEVRLDSTVDLFSVHEIRIASEEITEPSFTVTDTVMTNGCDVMVMRDYRLENCCGRFDEHREVYTFIRAPDLAVSALGKNDLGCIPNASLVPEPNITLVGASSECAWVDIAFSHETNAVTGGLCETSSVERVYSVTDVCGSNVVVTQSICWVVAEQPLITSTEGGQDWGCQASDWRPPTNVVATGATGTNVTESPVLDASGCTLFLSRVYSVTNCCGGSDTRIVNHTWTITPDSPEVDAIASTYIGCIGNINQIPAPSVALVSASSSCAIVSIDYLRDENPQTRLCTQSIDRVYLATDLCGATVTVTQTVSYTLNDSDPLLAVDAGTNFGCVAAAPVIPALWTDVPTALGQAGSNVAVTVTTSGCDRVMTRVYELVDCCGDRVDDTVTYTWTVEPAVPAISGPAAIDLGCIDSVATDVPGPDASALSVVADCGAVLSHVGDDAPVVSGCSVTFTRNWEAVAVCNQTGTFVQTITYTLDDEEPKFTSLPPPIDSGCNPPQDIAADMIVLSGVVTDNCDTAMSIMFTGSQTTTNGCQRSMSRSYMVMDDCGNGAVAAILHTWTVAPPAPTLTGPAAVSYGCVTDASLLPPPGAIELGMLTAAVTCAGSPVHLSDGPHTPAAAQTCDWSFERVYRLEDACGQAATFTQTVMYVLESIPVQITSAPADQVLGCLTAAPILPQLSDITTTGDVVTATSSVTTTTNGCDVTATIAFEIAGCCGSFDRAETAVSWTATPGVPSLAGAALIDLNCIDSLGDIPQPSASQFAVTAGCGAQVSFVGETAPNPVDNCFNEITRTYQVTDECNQTGTFEQVVRYILNDTPVQITSVEPGATIPGCHAGVPTNAIPAPAATATGNAVSLVPTATVTTNGCVATMVREYLAIDCCGNIDRATVEFSWNVLPAAPVITGPTQIDLQCILNTGAIPVPSTSQFNLQADCGATLAFVSDSAPTTTGCLTTMTRTYTAIDDCGQSTEFVQTITYSLANTRPEITSVPPVANLGCNGTVPAADWSGVAIAGDVLTSNITDSVSANGCEMILTRTWRVEDCCGNIDRRSTTYTWVDDTTAPALAASPGIDLGPTSLGCNPGVVDLPPVNTADITATDACGAVPVVFLGDTITTNGCTGTITRVYSATDDCGNGSTITQVFTFLSDTVAPEPAIIPASLDLGCSPAPADIPGPDASVYMVASLCGNPVVATNLISETRTNIGCQVVLTRMYEVTDECGNTGRAGQTLTWVADSGAPMVTCPPDADLGCNPASIPGPNPATVQVSDDCAAAIAATHVSDAVSTNGCTVTLVRTYQAVDGCLNTTSCAQTLTWTVDTELPQITSAPEGGPLPCGSAIPAADAALVQATDNCGVSVTLASSSTNDAGCIRTATHVYDVADRCGNRFSHTVVWTVSLDASAPVLSAGPGLELGPVFIGCNPDLVNLPTINPGLVDVADDCGATVVHAGDTIVTNGCTGTLIRVYSATDACGNEGTLTQIVSFVSDTVAPGLTLVPASIDLGCSPDVADIPDADESVASVINTCGSGALATNLISETVTNAGCQVVLTRTYEITDECGNTGEAVQRITWVEDNSAPAIVCPADEDLGCNPATIPAPNPALVSGADDCNAGTPEHMGDVITTNGCTVTLVRSYRSTDACGNADSCEQTLTWTVDSELPVLVSVPAGGELACNAAVPAPVLPEVTDNCGATATLAAVVTNDAGCVQTVQRDYLIADACGNRFTHTVIWTIPTDATDPVLTCPTPAPLAADASCEALLPDYTDGAATDTCELTSVTQTPAPGTVLGIGTHSVTLTATDACGNQTTCELTATVSGGCTTGITLEKTVYEGRNGVAGCAAAMESFTQLADTEITWCFRVTNTGTVPLDDVTISDTDLDPDFNTTLPGLLQPGQSVTLIREDTLTRSFVNTATITGIPVNGAPAVTDTDPADVTAITISEPPAEVGGGPMNPPGPGPSGTAGLAIRKTVAIGHGATCPGVKTLDREAGDDVTYCFEVSNIGGLDLRDVVVRDNLISSTPIAVGDLAAGAMSVVSVDAQYPGGMFTNVARAAGAIAGIPNMVGIASLDDVAVVTPPCGCVGGVVFQDLDNDGSAVGDNLANLGIPGVTVELLSGGTVLTTTTSDEAGVYTFPGLMSGDYTVRYVSSTLPGDFSGMTEQAVTVASGCDCLDNIHLGATPAPTAVELASFLVQPTATGLLFSWTTGFEDNALGFQILDSAGNVVTPRLVLAGQGEYAVHVAGLPADEYRLVEVTTDLAVEELAAVKVVDAAPQGPLTETVTATEGRAQFTTREGVTSYLVIGFDAPPTATIAAGDVLAGALLEVDGDHAIYLSPAVGVQLTVE